MTHKWSDIKKGRVSRKAYAKLLIGCRDLSSITWVLGRVIRGDHR
jgi:hypothetical protein